MQPLPTRDGRDAFLAVLEAPAPRRAQRQERTAGLHGTVPGWVIDEATQMLALVNRLRAPSGRQPATLEQVLRIEESAHGSDYAAKYALRCAFWLGERTGPRDDPARTADVERPARQPADTPRCERLGLPRRPVPAPERDVAVPAQRRAIVRPPTGRTAHRVRARGAPSGQLRVSPGDYELSAPNEPICRKRAHHG
ncbi:hypothetical protein SMD20_43570 [Nonomuraea sp. LP-02]|uniref:hypothetical protein n=1 Tax=Nonomuraea sp. LP-02 TaxID=3097960 RepID=UPI002E2EE39B|nr:hypothetical protein [Nonomuraea sp. LP-02]MED7931162.1 hypothetical protein [Nonomuraea sp. LP-02]